MEAAGYQDLLRPLFTGRRVILAGGPVSPWTPTAALVRRLGATAVLVVGTEGRGVGPPPEDAEWIAAGTARPSMLASIRAATELLRAPPAEVAAAVETFDPDRQALVIGSFLNEAPELCGRPFLAWRHPEWLALEDKLVADAVWDRSGVPRAPSEIVPLAAPVVDLQEVSRRFDRGGGTVWAADASAGWHGGAELLRWVRTPDDVEAVRAELRDHCRTARVMPFLEGIPCSIHGIVHPGAVSALRPVEQVSFRRPGQPRFWYAGCATFYDPPEPVRDAMREAARRVGEQLRATVGYRGAFSIDGIVTAGGFLPTELNPRSGAGVNTMLRPLPEIPFQLLLDALVGGIDLRYDPDDLETLVVAEADARRAGGTWHPTAVRPRDVSAEPVVGDAAGWAWSADGEAADGLVTAGESGVGGFVRLAADGDRTPVGPPFGPAAAAFWAFADRELGTEIGPLVAAAAPSPG